MKSQIVCIAMAMLGGEDKEKILRRFLAVRETNLDSDFIKHHHNTINLTSVVFCKRTLQSIFFDKYIEAEEV